MGWGVRGPLLHHRMAVAAASALDSRYVGDDQCNGESHLIHDRLAAAVVRGSLVRPGRFRTMIVDERGKLVHHTWSYRQIMQSGHAVRSCSQIMQSDAPLLQIHDTLSRRLAPFFSTTRMTRMGDSCG